jgi:hypothetical protein
VGVQTVLPDAFYRCLQDRSMIRPPLFFPTHLTYSCVR